jgi:pectate lyase
VPADFLSNWGGSAIHASDTLVNGLLPSNRVDLVAAYNASHDPDFATDVGWPPTLYRHIDPPEAVPALVTLGAGAGRAH